ncbi:uncharacterized protein RAG0_10929 [Rhynchosporium agropyri]|uniref:Uncharacterized protein n=1 Tax=Rhynchosporium agropyri TaxID=914238 RepID=A0A1E1L1W9_9HELO|nr:uncharacterized protein RAG0_10929 [Rhynchosporium agropyri]
MPLQTELIKPLSNGHPLITKQVLVHQISAAKGTRIALANKGVKLDLKETFYHLNKIIRAIIWLLYEQDRGTGHVPRVYANEKLS